MAVKDSKARREAVEETLPGAEELRRLADSLRALFEDGAHGRAIGFLRSLAATPPKVLLLEGGNAVERVEIALYWAMLLNCRQTTDADGPCLACQVCLSMVGRMHRDLVIMDGREGSIGIDEVRAVRSMLGEAARDAAFRVVILAEAQSLTEAAANAMLKSLEEALPTTVFVLTAPQRERLLPTLVSRSWTLTLAWPDPLASPDNGSETDWVATVAQFLSSGQGLFERTGVRGGIDAAGAGALLVACQRALVQALSGTALPEVPPGKSPALDVARYFAALPDDRRAIAAAVLDEGQESLLYQVNPALVVDWVLTRLYLLRPRGRRAA